MTERFINPESQFLDSSGKPRVNGKLAFHENGTLIDKDTFKDVNLTPALINANPLLLTADGRIPNCFYAGTARVIGTDDSGQFMDKDNVGISGTGAAFDTFNSVTEYEKGAIVVASDDEIYRSLQNNNQGNDPTSSPTFWEQVQFVGTFNVNITYADDDLVQASDGQLYRSIQAANLNNEPSASPTFWSNAAADQDLNKTDSPVFGGLTINGLTVHNGDVTYSNDNPELRGQDVDGILFITPDTANNLGGNIKLFGSGHATQADDIELRGSAIVQAHYDDSVSLWDFQANDMITTGTVRKPGTHPAVLTTMATGVTDKTGNGTVYTIVWDTEIFDQGGRPVWGDIYSGGYW